LPSGALATSLNPADKDWRATGFVLLLPFLEQQPLYDVYAQIDWNADYAQWQPLVDARPVGFECPSDTFAGRRVKPYYGRGDHHDDFNMLVTSYCFNAGGKWNQGGLRDYFVTSFRHENSERQGPFLVNV